METREKRWQFSPPEPSVAYKGKSLIKDTDYVVSYEDNTDGGMASVLVTGQGNFTGTVMAIFEIIMPEEQRKPINGVTATKISDRSYTGAGVEPKLEIYDGEKLLPASLDVTQNDDLSIQVADAAYNKGF